MEEELAEYDGKGDQCCETQFVSQVGFIGSACSTDSVLGLGGLSSIISASVKFWRARLWGSTSDVAVGRYHGDDVCKSGDFGL